MARKTFHGQVRSGDRPGAGGKRYQMFVHEGTQFQAGQPYMEVAAALEAPGLFAKADLMVESALRRLPDGVSFEVLMAMMEGELGGIAAAWASGATMTLAKTARRVAPRDTGALAEEIRAVYPAR